MAGAKSQTGRLASAAGIGALAIALGALTTSPAGAQTVCTPVVSGVSVTFDKGSPDPQLFTVPPGVTKLGATVEGGHGGAGSSASVPGGHGGQGGGVDATLEVRPGQCLAVYVGEAGQLSRVGDGYARGGQPGIFGGGGGGSSALVLHGSVPLVIAGGGGGGGGTEGRDPGGNGGAGGKDPEDGATGSGDGPGGRGGGETGRAGGKGQNARSFNPPIPGGGGGGAGGNGGDGGGVSRSEFAGGGGGGGGSTETLWPTFGDPTYYLSTACDRCDGVVTLNWTTRADTLPLPVFPLVRVLAMDLEAAKVPVSVSAVADRNVPVLLKLYHRHKGKWRLVKKLRETATPIGATELKIRLPRKVRRRLEGRHRATMRLHAINELTGQRISRQKLKLD